MLLTLAGFFQPVLESFGNIVVAEFAREIDRAQALLIFQCRVASCVECHGPGPALRNALYPRLAGQPAAYIELQLSLFRHGNRGGTPYAGIMTTVADRLEPSDIRDLAAYYASLPAEGGSAAHR